MSYKEKPLLKLYKFENNSFILQAVIDDYECCSWEKNKYEAGMFTIQINYNIPNAHLFEKGFFVQFGNDGADFGEIQNVTDVIGSDGKGSQIRTIEGRDARYIFKRRIIKSLNLGSAWSGTGNAETVMRNLINDQCGSNAETKRKLPVTVGSSVNLGGDVSVSEAFTNLYETLVTIATQGEIGWKVELQNNILILGFYIGVDRSSTIQFSTDYDSLSDGTFTDSNDSYANAVYVGGKGNNDDRDIYEGENAIAGNPEGLGRFECWDNQSSMTEESEYEAEANSVLSQYSQTISCDGRGLAKCPYIYKEQFDVGDTITVAFSGKSAKVQILAVTENWQKGDYNIDFSFGKPIVDLSRQLQLILKKIHTAEIEKESASTDSVKYYNIPSELIMPESDVTYKTIGFTGQMTALSHPVFNLYWREDGTGAKTYHVYFKQLQGDANSTLFIQAKEGKERLEFKPGTYVAIIYVDNEGNVKTGANISDIVSSPTTSYSSQKVDNIIATKPNVYIEDCTTAGNEQIKIVQLSNYEGYTLPDNCELNISFTYGNTYGDTTASTPTYPKLRIKNANGNDIKTVDICDSRGHYAGTGCWNDGDLMSFKVIGNKALIQNSDIRQSTSDYHILSDNSFENGTAFRLKDYNSTDGATIRVGYEGSALSKAQLLHIAGYASDGENSYFIKDINDTALSNFLGLRTDFTRVLKTGTGSWTATEDCFFIDMTIATTAVEDYKTKVNGINVSTQDSSSGIYMFFASGYVKKGDVISGSGRLRCFALK